ncbi:hypothetical protein BWI15_37865 [Kribbella sp. ALI-6-A]|uniref:hypothetical protein n=1 Tax=Kribbella sp. ALI-6-A TaxID=1933817 RepID=UPI00097CA3BD|nr:hypothetical protein [Kribbella sp. ALI-6-A]ONI68743.1 hypothetical protein BWI15_37865 [Kribbella sp. ALI-6-A]
MPEYDDQEQELGPTLADAFHTKADAAPSRHGKSMADEARRRLRQRRRNLMAASAAVIAVAVIGGGVWTTLGSPTEVATGSAGADSRAGAPEYNHDEPSAAGALGCEPQPAIFGGDAGPSPAVGLDLRTPVSSLQACRYRLTPGATALIGAGTFPQNIAQQVVDAIKVLPERNPALPVFKCTPEAARPSEAIVLRFTTAQDIREIWVQYDGCATAGFLNGRATYGLFAGPLKLFMTGAVRPSGGVYLDHLKGW